MAKNVVHFAIAVDDRDRARRLYEAVFAWLRGLGAAEGNVVSAMNYLPREGGEELSVPDERAGAGA